MIAKSTLSAADQVIDNLVSSGMGQLGNGDNVYQSVPVQVLEPEGKGHLASVVAIAGGEAHNVAVTADGKVWAWGVLAGGKRSNYPVAVEGLDSVTAVASRGYHTLAVKKDGSVWAWGMNANRCLGIASTQPTATVPERVQGVNDPIMVSAGHLYSLALLKDHTVVAWGHSKPAASGTRMVDSNSPVAVKGLTDVVSISAGWEHALAVKSDGTVWSWGSGVQGELGAGGKPLSVKEQFDLTGSADRNPKPPYCTNSNVPVQVKWP